MTKYKPLNLTQRQEIENLAAHFTGPSLKTIFVNNADQKKLFPAGFIRVADLLNPKQKTEIDQHEKKVKIGYEKYSAY